MSQNTSKLVLFVGLTVYTPLSLKPAEKSSAQSRAEDKHKSVNERNGQLQSSAVFSNSFVTEMIHFHKSLKSQGTKL